jgi:predicted PurR-regulated permease PerM
LDVNQEKTFFYFVLFLIIALLLLLWLPFINTVFLAMIFAAVLYPLYEKILKMLGGRRTVASFAAIASFVLVSLVPLVLIGTVIANDLTVWVKSVPGYLDSPPAGVKRLFMFFGKYLHVPEKLIREELISQVGHIESYIVEISRFFMSNTIKLTVNILVFLMSLFCFFRDGHSLLGIFIRTIPMPEKQSLVILNRLNSVSRSAARGVFMNAVAVSFISMPGFYIAGLPLALWCLAAGIGILIPVIGSLTVWTAATLVMLFTTGLKPAFFIACYGVAVIGVCDNILGPYLMRGSEKISPIWILFSILGGIQMFGIPGILIGPVLFAAMIAFVDAYRKGSNEKGMDVTHMAK